VLAAASEAAEAADREADLERQLRASAEERLLRGEHEMRYGDILRPECHRFVHCKRTSRLAKTQGRARCIPVCSSSLQTSESRWVIRLRRLLDWQQDGSKKAQLVNEGLRSLWSE
jgi:hypothetical protein